jgi:hypothetical protein
LVASLIEFSRTSVAKCASSADRLGKADLLAIRNGARGYFLFRRRRPSSSMLCHSSCWGNSTSWHSASPMDMRCCARGAGTRWLHAAPVRNYRHACGRGPSRPPAAATCRMGPSCGRRKLTSATPAWPSMTGSYKAPTRSWSRARSGPLLVPYRTCVKKLAPSWPTFNTQAA